MSKRYLRRCEPRAENQRRGRRVRDRLDRPGAEAGEGVEARPGLVPVASHTEVDLAIDYNEDVSLGAAAADALETFLRARGVTAVRSSVHVNCWLGDFDKLKAVRRFVKTEWKKSLARDDERYVYVGDSFNDAPLFGAFALSVGVANVRDVLATLDAPPKFITRAREAKGFGEVADAIVRTRKGRSA